MRRRVLVTLALAGIAMLALGMLASSMPLPGSDAPDADEPTRTPPTITPQTRTTMGDGAFPSIPYDLLLLVAAGIVVSGALVGLYRTIGTAENPTFGPVEELEAGPGSDEGVEEASLEAVAETAGEAADRLRDSSDAEVANEVYRAWREMTTHLAVSNRRARTPGEFADAAVRAGMAESDVRALTQLFEAVRYGHEDASDDRERRAIDLLDRIESTYGSEG